MKYLKARLTGQGKVALLGMGFGSRSYYYAWDILCETYGRSDVIANAQFKKTHTLPPEIQRNLRASPVFANVVTNVVNNLTQLGYISDLEAETVLN